MNVGGLPRTMTISQVARAAKRDRATVWRRLLVIDGQTGGALLSRRKPGVSNAPIDVDVAILLREWPGVFERWGSHVDPGSEELRREFKAMMDRFDEQEEAIRDQQNQIAHLTRRIAKAEK